MVCIIQAGKQVIKFDKNRLKASGRVPFLLRLKHALKLSVSGTEEIASSEVEQIDDDKGHVILTLDVIWEMIRE
jgi:hypothetical protein